MKARPMTVKLLLWLVKLAVDASPADQSRLVSSRLVCSSIRIVPGGGNQMSPVVPVFCRVSYFSLLQCSGASHNDSWDVLQKQTFLPANTSSPYRWYIQGESVDMILLVAASEWPRKRSCRPFISDDRGRACVWLYTDSLVTWSWRLMPNISRRQLSWKVSSLSHSDSVRVHVSDH